MHTLPSIIVAGTLAFVPLAAFGEHADQLFKLTPTDAAEWDLFGHAVGLSGSVAVIGAPGNQVSPGAAYLFVADYQLFELTASDASLGDRVGDSVGIDGPTAVIGAPGDDDLGNNAGAAYVFDTSSGQQTFKLLPDDGVAGDSFGKSVAISGPRAIVGASEHDDNGIDSGAAYIFDTNTGAQLHKLLPDDGAPGDLFGSSVAISGALAIVGAHGNDDGGSATGSAYLFNATTGHQIFKFLPNNAVGGEQFGRAVAIDGATAVIGASASDENGTNSGSAYLFDTATGQERAKLLPYDGDSGDLFGSAVAIAGSIAVVAAVGSNDNGSASGSAYYFNAITGEQIAKLVPEDGVPSGDFGGGVAISGTMALVGSRGDTQNGYHSGSAYIYRATISTGPCPGDCNDDGVVGFADLLTVLQNWGCHD